ncbi:hypothetical protein AB0E04_43510 [Streptomyces sp. NPDC048251]|uniref:hypothetical protein n=1 Tax=Streptomyces sp. NPDC048251 TaxID=3154501 RepID=UPI003444F847
MTRAQRRPSGFTAVRIRRHATGLLMAGGLIALSACGSGDDSDGSAKGPVPTSSAPAPETSSASADTQKQAKDTVLQAYEDFWAEQVKAYGQADIKGTNLKKYATKKALGRAMGDVLVMKEAGTTTEGAPTHKATVTSLTLTGDVPKASLSDCLDISGWKTVKTKTGAVQPFPSNQPLRYVTTAKAERWGNQWMITDLTPDGNRTC